MTSVISAKNPGVQAGALSVRLESHLPFPSTLQDRQAQQLACRFGLRLSMARHIAFLAYGGGCHE